MKFKKKVFRILLTKLVRLSNSFRAIQSVKIWQLWNCSSVALTALYVSISRTAQQNCSKMSKSLAIGWLESRDGYFG